MYEAWCIICGQRFGTPQDYQNHLLQHHLEAEAKFRREQLLEKKAHELLAALKEAWPHVNPNAPIQWDKTSSLLKELED